MGCTESKISDQTAVHRCEQRKSLLKQAVAARGSLASAHARYIHSISSTAAAFKDFSSEEFAADHPPVTASSAPPPPRSPPHLEGKQPPSSAFFSSSSEASTSSSEMITTIGTTVTTKRSTTMRLWRTPMATRTVVLSPPRDPRYISIGRRGHDVDADVDDDEYYRPPPPPDPYHHRHNVATTSPPPPALSGDWDDLVDIFRPPPGPPPHILSDDDDVDDVDDDDDDDEDIPPLEEEGEEDDDDDDDDGEEDRVGVMFRDVKQDVLRGKMKVVDADGGAADHQRVESDASSVKEAFEEGSSSSSSNIGKDRRVSQDETRTMEEDVAAAAASSPMELLDLVHEHFVKASEAGRPVLRMLEARKVHNNLDKGISDSSSRLLSALSLGRWSPRTMSSSRDDFESLLGQECGMTGSHTGTLERLYAWEKKLFEEVKSWESLNVEFGKKRKVLRNQDAKGAKVEAIDRTRASMKALETQMSVALQAIEASSAAIQRITDEELLPQLLELLEGILGMWKGMQESHLEMYKAFQLAKLYQDPVLEATSTSHRNATLQLETCLTSWHTTLSSFTNSQREYMKFLKQWIDTQFQERESTRRTHQRKVAPKIQFLCQEWYVAFDSSSSSNTEGAKRSSTAAAVPAENSNVTSEKFVPIIEAVERMVTAIKTFTETLREIGRQQAEEIKIQKRGEALSKELNKKIMSMNSGDKKNQDVLRDKEAAIDALRIKVEDEKHKFTRAIQQTRFVTTNSLQDSLPLLFKELSDSALICMNTYQNLYSRVNSHGLS